MPFNIIIISQQPLFAGAKECSFATGLLHRCEFLLVLVPFQSARSHVTSCSKDKISSVVALQLPQVTLFHHVPLLPRGHHKGTRQRNQRCRCLAGTEKFLNELGWRVWVQPSRVVLRILLLLVGDDPGGRTPRWLPCLVGADGGQSGTIGRSRALCVVSCAVVYSIFIHCKLKMFQIHIKLLIGLL